MSIALEILFACGLVDLVRGGKYLRIARNCTSLMLFLVNDILDFSQLEAKKLVLNIEDGISPEKVLSECIELLSFKAESKGL